MKSLVLPALLSATLSLVSSGVATAQSEPRQPAPKEKPSVWTVVQVDDDFQAVEKSNYKAFQKGLTDKYNAERKAWQDARKEAAKNKEKFTTPPPKRPKVKPTNKTFKSEEEASQYVIQLREELEKKKKSKA